MSAAGRVQRRKRMRRLAFTFLLGLSIVVGCLAPSSAVATEKPVYYVALGDSLAIGRSRRRSTRTAQRRRATPTSSPRC
jgi:hypothetical protein